MTFGYVSVARNVTTVSSVSTCLLGYLGHPWTRHYHPQHRHQHHHSFFVLFFNLRTSAYAAVTAVFCCASRGVQRHYQVRTCSLRTTLNIDEYDVHVVHYACMTVVLWYHLQQLGLDKFNPTGSALDTSLIPAATEPVLMTAPFCPVHTPTSFAFPVAGSTCTSGLLIILIFHGIFFFVFFSPLNVFYCSSLRSSRT